MSDTLRGFRSFGIYLLPAFLLAAVGTLLMALLYYPAPSAVPVAESRHAATTNRDDRQARAEALFAAMLLDALRELRPEQKTRARTLMYRYEQNLLPATEQPTLLRIESPATVQNDDERGFGHPILIRL